MQPTSRIHLLYTKLALPQGQGECKISAPYHWEVGEDRLRQFKNMQKIQINQLLLIPNQN